MWGLRMKKAKTKTLEELAGGVPCCYRGQRASLGQAAGSEVGYYPCSCPAAVPEVATIDAQFARSRGELDANVTQDGKQRHILMANCLACPHRSEIPATRTWQPGEIVYRRTVDLIADTAKLYGQIPDDVSAVVGLPRSGMISATQIALQLNLPLYSLDKHEGLRPVGAGSRESRLLDRAAKLLVIDDSVYVGTAISWARQQLAGRKAVYAAVYARRPEFVDIYAVEAPSPHLFEWNIFNNGVIAGHSADKRLRGGICFDFDGVICENPVKPYTPRTWLPAAVPTGWMPRFVEIPLVITARLERWRKPTEQWLKRYGVKVKEMIMHPARSEKKRDKIFDVAEYKGAGFRDSKCSLMFESEPNQAAIIAATSGKPVIVPRTGEVFV